MLRCAESLHDVAPAARDTLRSRLSGPMDSTRTTVNDGSTRDGGHLRRVACTASVAAAGFEATVCAGTVTGWRHRVVPPGERPAKAGSTSCPCSAGSSSWCEEPGTAGTWPSRSAPCRSYRCLRSLYSLVRVSCRVSGEFTVLEEYVMALRRDLVTGSLLALAACGDALASGFHFAGVEYGA
jgi:hypothetical protein